MFNLKIRAWKNVNPLKTEEFVLNLIFLCFILPSEKNYSAEHLYDTDFQRIVFIERNNAPQLDTLDELSGIAVFVQNNRDSVFLIIDSEYLSSPSEYLVYIPQARRRFTIRDLLKAEKSKNNIFQLSIVFSAIKVDFSDLEEAQSNDIRKSVINTSEILNQFNVGRRVIVLSESGFAQQLSNGQFKWHKGIRATASYIAIRDTLPNVFYPIDFTILSPPIQKSVRNGILFIKDSKSHLRWAGLMESFSNDDDATIGSCCFPSESILRFLNECE